ncbi:rab escort protein [Coprinopsis marcescibilis]|uniref:Rab escort protein n=1 Tax=Coprinopsis marcescibilis TaxID=230819 RepID=A0A5C3L987_COPMA|nr:rab escort protein [Coprinopsis marcescibilis]
MSNDSEANFDIVIIGTGLTESITAAALSKAKYKVAHIDPNAYYGGNEASLSQDELISWGEAVNEGRHSKFSSFSTSSTTPLPFSRQYSICLRPSIIPALGPLISSLIASGVSKYSGFKLLSSVNIYSSNGKIQSVPGSKEDVFHNKEISLIEKRRLMRFLTFAAGDFEEKVELEGKKERPFIELLTSTFSLSQELSTVIAYSLAHCVGPSDPALPSLARLRSYLKSIGRYGPSPFLIGHYGGIGDVSQGFCRASAVHGGVYILGRTITEVEYAPPGSGETSGFTFILDDFPEALHSQLVISTHGLKPGQLDVPSSSIPVEETGPYTVARGIIITDRAPIYTNPQQTSAPEGEEAGAALAPVSVDASLLVFPPSSVGKGSQTHSATVHITGDTSLSTPKGKWILYIVLPITGSPPQETAEEVLQPYVDALLALTEEGQEPICPLSASYFFELPESAPLLGNQLSPKEVRHITVPPLNYSTFPELPDSATRHAEAVFTFAVQAIQFLKGEDIDETEIEFWPPIEENDGDDDSDS